MRSYHPLDTRHKANKPGAAKTSPKPWHHVADPPPPPGAQSRPISDSESAERRARERIGKEAERAALDQAPFIANLFGPATFYYTIRAALIGEGARARGNGRIAMNIAGAFVLYFLLMYLDRQFGLNELLGGSASMQSID